MFIISGKATAKRGRAKTGDSRLQEPEASPYCNTILQPSEVVHRAGNILQVPSAEPAPSMVPSCLCSVRGSSEC